VYISPLPAAVDKYEIFYMHYYERL
jgi:hypothetical protein